MNSAKPLMLIEDDQVDAMIVERAVRDLSIRNELVHVSNGELALEYLNDPHKQNPCVILLDLNMPRMNGKEFLEIIKQDVLLKMIPVIVLTSSQDQKDKAESFRLGVSGYMLKPVGYQQFVDVVRTVELYWTMSELPPLD
jgi:CheY-like chemotaxis protein